MGKGTLNIKKKYVRVLAIFFIVGFIGTLAGTLLYLDYREDKTLQFGNIEVGVDDYEAITTPLPEGQFALCSLKEEDKDNPCVILTKVGLDD